MTNEEYQRQAAERSRQADEARRRQAIEDSNRHQREQAARNAQIQKENYSRSLGMHGVNPPLFGPPVDGPTYNRARQTYDANQKLFGQLNQTSSSGRSSGSYSSGYSGGAGKGKSAGAGLLVLLIIIVAIAYSGSHPNSTNSQSTDNTSQTPNTSSSTYSGAQPSSPAAIAKPSPINQDQSQPPVPPLDSSTQSTTAAPQSDNSAAIAPVPVVPPADNALPSLPYGVSMSAKRDGFDNGCKHGELVLQPTAINFTCASDPDKSVAVSVEQVKDLDNNGIVVFPKQKYHFDIEGKQKEEVRDLFALWLTNARRTLSAQGSN